ncbi:hypothetical protein B0T40_09880 [Chromobacterium haemolyticum]|nr:hypothetical protein B0T40_09880 [Chromobacterium haemolyticum]
MWSHYAGSHTGICIRFNLLNQLELAQSTYRVNYTKQRPVTNLLKKQTFVDYENTILTKSYEWRYENEWRCTNRIHNLKKIPLNSDVIDEVLIGAKATTDTIEFIHQINEERKSIKLPEFKITLTMMHDTEFKIIPK